MLRADLPFNHNWLYLPREVDESVPDTDFTRVTLPHSSATLPHHSFHDREYQFIATYRKHFTPPKPLNGQRLYLHFEGAMLAARVQINGYSFVEHRGGYVPFTLDLTKHLKPDGDNLLVVYLDSTERADIPPFGHTVDYLAFDGIYREVHLQYRPALHIHDLFVRPQPDSDNAAVEIDVWLKNTHSTAQQVKLHARTLGDDIALSGAESQPLDVPPGETVKHTLHLDAAVYRRWSLDAPALYTAEVTLHDANDIPIDQDTRRFGVREAIFREDGFYLNGERIPLRGLNRHQTYPYIGAAAPKRLQQQDADTIKYDLGCNIVRTSHYPQSRHFLDRCDEIGLLVFEEIPGWQFIGDADWQSLALRDLRIMVERDRSRPSIVLWGVRINESWDDTGFYTQTNALARELDPTRQTGGVRFFMGSEQLEDVYTLNDFSNGIIAPVQGPHLVTEFAGHMFPTKPWDPDTRRVDHALLHAKIQDLAAGTPLVSGAIGWCAFDYNTHQMFGAGDRICYHGVMDIFRLPKYAAHFYASQAPPSQQVVLKAATNWSLGDRDEGLHDPLVIFTNCDEVEVFIGAESQGRFQPDRDIYPHLLHPPVTVTHLSVMLAQPYDDLRLVGYIEGKAVVEQRIDADGQPKRLLLRCDTTALHADGSDMTRVVFQVVDQYDNVLPYATRAVSFTVETDTDAELIGENPFALVGGQAAVYLRTGTRPGALTLKAKTPRLPEASCTITLVKPSHDSA